MANNLDEILGNMDRNIKRLDKEKSIKDLKKSVLNDYLSNMDSNINRLNKEKNNGFER